MKKRRAITIREVARAAGVSTAAVSQVFNSRGRISEETRKKISLVARKLKYHPNTHARTLGAKNSQTLGIIVSDIENPFFAAVVKSFEAQALRHGYDAIASETNYDVHLMRRAAERMLEQEVGGVAVMTSEMSPAWLDEMLQRGMPVMGLDLEYESDQVSNIRINYLGAMQQLVEHLYSFGHRKIAYVGGRRKLKNVLSRFEGYQRAMASLGLDAGPPLIGNQRLDGGYTAGLSILGMSERPTAVVAVNDLTAVGLISAFSEGKLRVPQDISVTGFDNTYLAAYYVPRITTVDIHPDLVGRTSADALFDAIAAHTMGGKEYAIRVDLVVGKSTGPAPGFANRAVNSGVPPVKFRQTNPKSSKAQTIVTS